MFPNINWISTFKHLLTFVSSLVNKFYGQEKFGKGLVSSGRRRSSFIVTPNGECHKTTMEYVLPLLLLPLLLGRQGLLTAWVIYLYPLDAVLKQLRMTWARSSPQLWTTLSQGIDRVERKFLGSTTAVLMNQILFFSLADKWFEMDRRTSLYTLIFYNFLTYFIRYLQDLRVRGEDAWATVSISNSTNIRHLAMSATKLVLEWTKMVTFVATLITFILVLHLDSFGSTFPPVSYTLLTLTYYLVTEDKLHLSVNFVPNLVPTLEQIQGLESLYFQILNAGFILLINACLLLSVFRSNPKLCCVTLYHNGYLQYRNVRNILATIDNEWKSVDEFRQANDDEVRDLDDVCAVCLNPLESQVRVTKCRHFFHAHCLRLYLKAGTPFCPLCKRNLVTGFDCNAH